MRFLCSLLAIFLFAGCAVNSGQAPEPGTSSFDSSYLTSDLWNDGQAEVAFYQVTRNRDQYGRDVPQAFLAGTYLVKHDFDEARGSKATADAEVAVPAFKYALFYEFESRSYEYKRSWVVNAAQQDLRPLKASFSSFDWCANQYREYVFREGDLVDHLYRSDDYGNADESWRLNTPSYPSSLMPVLVRALDAESMPTSLQVLDKDGSVADVRVVFAGRDTLMVAGEFVEGDRISLTYSEPVESMIGETTSLSETWWRARTPDRRLLAMTSDDGRYRMDLVEILRSPYWQEDLYSRLSRVTERP